MKVVRTFGAEPVKKPPCMISIGILLWMYLEDRERFLAMTFNIIKNVHDYHHAHDYDHYFDLDQYHDNDQIMNMTMTKKVIQNCVWYLFIKLPFSIWSYWKFILIYLQNFIYSSFSPKRIMILASNCFACISELRRRAGQRFSGSNFTFFRFSFSTFLISCCCWVVAYHSRSVGRRREWLLAILLFCCPHSSIPSLAESIGEWPPL